MALEFASDPSERSGYPLPLESGAPLTLDWRPLIGAVLEDVRAGVATAIIASRFHNALTDGIVRVCEAVGNGTVALSGGCFQNRRLTEATRDALEGRGFEVLVHRQVPPNDGGIALGQIVVAASSLAKG
jgi:hydrogenase maturation protein HypF